VGATEDQNLNEILRKPIKCHHQSMVLGIFEHQTLMGVLDVRHQGVDSAKRTSELAWFSLLK